MSRRRLSLSSQEKAVLAVISYSAQFNFPLTVSEVTDRLLTPATLKTLGIKGNRVVWGSSKSQATKQAKQILNALVKKELLIKKDNYFTLVDRAGFQLRTNFKQIKKQKEPLVTELVNLVKGIPWVLGVALTGSYAAGGATAQDDVDFLIITKNNRLWLTRLTLLLQAVLRGRRLSFPGGDISHGWDLNFWLAESKLALPANKQTLYEAYEVLQTNWVYTKQDIQQQFYQANPWVADHIYFWQPAKSSNKIKQSHLPDLLNWLDWLAYYLQVGYRQLRHGKQRADKHRAFFHPSTTRGNILRNWQRIYKRVA